MRTNKVALRVWRPKRSNEAKSRSLRTEIRPIFDEPVFDSTKIDTGEEPRSPGSIIVGYRGRRWVGSAGRFFRFFNLPQSHNFTRSRERQRDYPLFLVFLRDRGTKWETYKAQDSPSRESFPSDDMVEMKHNPEVRWSRERILFCLYSFPATCIASGVN